jgi:hypothetical protein
MRSKLSMAFAVTLVLAGSCLTARHALAGSTIPINATLNWTCTNCDTAVGLFGTATSLEANGTYSLLPPSPGFVYLPSNVESEILTHNSVYTLNTTNTSETVQMDFYAPAGAVALGASLPACWSGNTADSNGIEGYQNQTVDWSVFVPNSVSYTTMSVGQSVMGHARLDFNVRPQCQNQIYRYYLEWSQTCITRTSRTTWTATGDPCGATTNYGTASLYGQGGKHGQTVYYGDFRLPFLLQLQEPQ